MEDHPKDPQPKDPAAVALGRRGGKARAKALGPRACRAWMVYIARLREARRRKQRQSGASSGKAS